METHQFDIFAYPPHETAEKSGAVALYCPACGYHFGTTTEIGASSLRAKRTAGHYLGGCCSASKGHFYVFSVWRGTRPTYSPAGRPQYLANGARDVEPCVYFEAFCIKVLE